MKTLDDYELEVENSNKKCKFCNSPLKDQPVEHYEHDGGYEVEGFKNKQWLYVTCPKKSCGYQWALHKLGI